MRMQQRLPDGKMISRSTELTSTLRRGLVAGRRLDLIWFTLSGGKKKKIVKMEAEKWAQTKSFFFLAGDWNSCNRICLCHNPLMATLRYFISNLTFGQLHNHWKCQKNEGKIRQFYLNITIKKVSTITQLYSGTVSLKSTTQSYKYKINTTIIMTSWSKWSSWW